MSQPRLEWLLTAWLVATCVAHCNAEDRAAKLKVDTDIVYAEPDGTKLLMDVYHPAGAGPHPAVLVIHGGAWLSGDRHQLQLWARELAERGYCACAIDYRLAPKFKFPAQIDDCRSALEWVRKNAKDLKVDTQRIGAIGYSAGGHLVSLLGTTGQAPSDENKQTDTRLQCVIAGGAPCDFRSLPEKANSLTYWLGGSRKEKPDVYEQASPAAFVDKDDPPTFFFNGTKDTLVPITWTQPLFDELKKADVETELYEVEGADHIRAVFNRKAREAGYDFLDRHLKQDETN